MADLGETMLSFVSPANFSTVCSTVGQNFAAKVRNSAGRAANMGMPKYLASATLCDTVKTSEKNLSRIMSPLLYPLRYRPSRLDEYLANSVCFRAFSCATMRNR
jgi:hypothetical protein